MNNPGPKLASALAALLLASCSGGGDLGDGQPTIHAAGYEYVWSDTYGDIMPVATYWTSKGDPKPLGDGLRSSVIRGSGLFVDDGNNVYCVGFQVGADGYWCPRVWKNGGFLYDLQLSSGMKDGEAKGVFVRGNNVYVVGIEYDWDFNGHPALWINRIPQPLGSGGSLPDYGGYGQADSVFVSSSGDVYVSGMDNYTNSYWEENDGYGLAPPTVWVNGNPKHLNDGYTFGSAFSIAMANNSVYAVGFEADFGSTDRSAKLWELSPGTYGSLRSTRSIGAGTGSSSASSVYASGSDVYVALWEHDPSSTTIAKYYKNGSLYSLGDGSMVTQALGISGHDGNVYVVGAEREIGSGNINVAKYWKDGKPYTISSGNYEAVAYGIVVK